MAVEISRDRKTIRYGALLLSAAWLAPPGAASAQRATDAPADIRVIGHRDPEGLLPDQTEPKAVSEISSDFIVKQAPTLNAFQLVSLLPGANVASSDPYGLSTSSSLTLRGLGQDEIGVLMEGAPQNDIGYYYAYPSQFADAENVRAIRLAQGAVDLASPTVGGTGGLLSLSLDDPKAARGMLADLSLGSYNMHRAFVRVDTGTIGNTGLKAFLSYSNTRADNWRGAGYDLRQHVDAKLLGEWGNGNRVSLALSYNDANSSSYASPTLADWRARGRGFNYDAEYVPGETRYWELYRAPFRNLYASAPVHLVLGDRLTLDATTYLQFGYGNSPYGTQLATTGNFLGSEELAQPIALPGAANGVATVLGNYTGDQMRTGQVASLTLRAGMHRLTAGLWFDYGTDRVTQTYTAVGTDGRPADRWGYRSKAIRTADGRLLAYENQRTVTVTKSVFVADSIALSPRLTVDIGFKGVNLLRNGRNYLPGPQTRVRSDSFAALPRAAVHYDLDDRQQVFANVTTNFRTPNEFTLYDSYDGGVVSTRGTDALKNEYSVSQEIGYRYIGPSLSASVTGFHYKFRNRQLATVVDNGGALVNSTLNAGGQTSYGVDAEIDYRPARGVSVYVSGEYLRARIDDDLPVGGDYLPTQGKRAVSSPTLQFGAGGTYDDGHLFGSIAGKYVGRQYATFMNDESIPGYATLDLAIGVHLADWLDGKRTDLRVNAINVTDPHVLAGVQSVTTNARDVVGRGGTIIMGNAPSYYIGGGSAVVATISRGF
ncbi:MULTISPECIES: TonB-dependent receptor domain-containing protein [unclassified Sphingomonas]|uniref:TonB-dependent receptor n=1 Tax=unclassified Sphingomonas TaxID=196159 RepID=UPI00285F51A0|nr:MULTISPECIES: TonB-dependent receptor [unclassified Sphingomonas]MDR6116077.1 iron complex outermembrane receptor protein [Sphingomonas sp. SORGH_AS_0789]MDR6150250.1 iron complex outermembrane receptor protein [Sphingomonas sp. SORGH_AS_0742]